MGRKERSCPCETAHARQRKEIAKKASKAAAKVRRARARKEKPRDKRRRSRMPLPAPTGRLKTKGKQFHEIVADFRHVLGAAVG